VKRLFAGLFVAARCRFRLAGNAAPHEEIRQRNLVLRAGMSNTKMDLRQRLSLISKEQPA